MTKANIKQVFDSILMDMHIFEDVAEQAKNDVLGTLATNMQVFAGAIHEERNGREEFVGDYKPSECLEFGDYNPFGEICECVDNE